MATKVEDPNPEEGEAQPAPATSSQAAAAGDNNVAEASKFSQTDDAYVAKEWHCEESQKSHRENMIQRVFDLLRIRFPTKTAKSILSIAQELEKHMYFAAKNFNEYVNTSTIKQRLHGYALTKLNAQLTCSLCGSFNATPPPAPAPGTTPLCTNGCTAEHQKQQRLQLLLLRHAARCCEGGDCSVSRHCATMKACWDHIRQCQSPSCGYPRCAQSKKLLSHYANCKAASCSICPQVRAAIRRSSTRSTGPTSADRFRARSRIGRISSCKRRSAFINEIPPNRDVGRKRRCDDMEMPERKRQRAASCVVNNGVNSLVSVTRVILEKSGKRHPPLEIFVRSSRVDRSFIATIRAVSQVAALKGHIYGMPIRREDMENGDLSDETDSDAEN